MGNLAVMEGPGSRDQGPGAGGVKSLKDCSDAEIHALIDRALEEIRKTPHQYGEIKITVAGGRVKFLTVERPVV